MFLVMEDCRIHKRELQENLITMTKRTKRKGTRIPMLNLLYLKLFLATHFHWEKGRKRLALVPGVVKTAAFPLEKEILKLHSPWAREQL